MKVNFLKNDLVQIITIVFPLIMTWVFVILEQKILFIIFLILTLMILVYFYSINLNLEFLYKKIQKGSCLHNQTEKSVKNIYSLFTKNKQVKIISKKLSIMIYPDIPRAGIIMDPYLITLKNLGSATLFVVFGIPISIILFVYFEELIFLLMVFVVPVILMWTKIKLMMLTAERKTKISDELAFFSIYAWILQSSGRSLMDIIYGICGMNILPYMEKEMDIISRDVGFFPENPLDVVNKRALEHPNPTLRNLLVGYVSIYKDGGDLVNYLEKTTEDMFSQLKTRFGRYEEQAKSLAILTSAIFSMLPIFLVTGMFIMTADTLASITIMIFVMMPVVGVGIYMLIDLTQPKFSDELKFNLLSLPIGITGSIFGYFVLGELWIAMIFGVLFLTTANTVLTLAATIEIKNTNAALGNFLRDVTESRKVGNPISVAIHKISKNRKYNNPFDRKIISIASFLHFGLPLSKCIHNTHDDGSETVKMRSWLGRMTFFILGKMDSAGNVNAQSLEILTGYMIKIKNLRQDMNASLQMFWIMAYVNPFIMAYISKMLKGWFETSSTTKNLAMDYLAFNVVTSSSEFLSLINITIALCSITLGLLINKIVNFNIAYTTNLIIMSVITFIAIWIGPYYPTNF